MSFVTFIIPTLGRYSLHRTLQSLREQTDPDWNAVVVFDNHDVSINEEEKLLSFRYDKGFDWRTAGPVRNAGLPFVTGEWTAFVDDDDFLDRAYVASLRSYANKGYDLVQFTYKDVENGNTQPPKNLNKLVACNFGISFAVRTEFREKNKIRFQIGGIEDYQFLQDCLDSGAKWIITHDIKYYVGHRSAWN